MNESIMAFLLVSHYNFLRLFASWKQHQANLSFCAKLVRGLAPLPMMGPKVNFLTSGTAPASFLAKAQKIVKGASSVSSLRDGVPDELEPESVYVLVSPSVRQDYLAAQQIASSGIAKAVVMVNGLAKVRTFLGRN